MIGTKERSIRGWQASTSIALIITCAVTLRLIIAYALLPANAGFAADLNAFRGWAADLGANGPLGAYSRGYFLDYLPGYLWVLWLLGSLAGAITGAFDPGALVKIPAILADGLLILATVRLASHLGASARAQRGVALLLAFAPMTWLNSAVWGQVDSVGTSVLLFATSELIQGKTLRAAALAALAAVIKPQFGILIPFVALLALLRARRSGDMWALPLTGLVGTAVVSIAALPFGLTVLDVIGKVGEAAGNYPYLSVNAWNPWALVDSAGAGLFANGTWGSDLTPLFGAGPPAVICGAALLVAAGIVALWSARKDHRAHTVIAVTFVAIAFFLLPTRVHERYLFPAIPLTLALAAALPRWRVIAATISVAFLLNAWGALTLAYLKNPGLPDLGPLTEALHTPVAILAVVAATLVAFIAAARELLRDQSASAADTSNVKVKKATPPPQHVTQSEPRRVLNRVDLWMLLVITVTALSLRGWRVGEPTRFEFDEVYHVRTATEFMQFWRYGEPHAIYEYTHPHVAKYAIAAGLQLFGAPRVDGRSEYGTAITAITSRPAGAYGKALIWIATADGIDVINASTHTKVARIDVHNVTKLFAADDGSLWGASPVGVVFHASVLGAESGASSEVKHWNLALSGVTSILALNDVLFVTAGDEVMRVSDGVISATAPARGATDTEVVNAEGTERLAVAGADGVTMMLAEDLSDATTTSVPGGVRVITAVEWFETPRIYAATADQVAVYTLNKSGPAYSMATISISGATEILGNDATRIMHVIAPGPSSNKQVATLWSIEPNGNARFADVSLGVDTASGEGGEAWRAPTTAIAGATLDASASLPDGGSSALLVAWPNGGVAQLSVGDLTAGWRWPGVAAGALAAALLALLARLLTERRDVAALVGALALLDGAGFVQSRIGMNDVYLLAALLAACCAFVAWLQGRTRGPLASAALLVITGTTLGVALASKWVALYGAGALGAIWLSRSAPGRIAVALGLALLGALLLPAALATTAESTRLPNLPFAVVALITLAAVGAATWRAGGLSRASGSLREAVRFTTARFARFSGEAVLVGLTLIALPLGVYVISYLPWAALGNQIVPGWPPGNTGVTLADLTASMYRYHDTLRVAHAASSPWWAWPFDLKPVWFSQESFSALGAWTGDVYDGGNVASRIIGLAGTAWIALQAWRQRSAGLTAVLVIYLALWLPWARIDRAAFQYHYFPSSQIALIALALLLADLRRGDQLAARFVRVGVGALIIVAPLLWLATGLLCTVAGVSGVYSESQVCLAGGLSTPGPIIGAAALVPAAYAAWVVQHVSEPKRLFRWTIAVIAGVALIWYPNWSALPLPTAIHNAYQGILPTWTWAFQFGVTLEKPGEQSLVGAPFVVALAALGGAALLGYSLFKYMSRRELNKNRTEGDTIRRE
jgi:hypothetical protein